jgi:hypothetical protein
MTHSLVLNRTKKLMVVEKLPLFPTPRPLQSRRGRPLLLPLSQVVVVLQLPLPQVVMVVQLPLPLDLALFDEIVQPNATQARTITPRDESSSNELW